MDEHRLALSLINLCFRLEGQDPLAGNADGGPSILVSSRNLKGTPREWC